MQIVSIPFDNLANEDGTYKFGETQVAEDMPVLSQAMFWDSETQSWLQATKSARQGWGAYKDREIQAGEPFFLKNVSSEPVEVTAAGEVPDGKITRRAFGNGLSFVSHPYPVDSVFGSTEIAEQLPPLSEAMFWDVDSQSWLRASKSARQGWGAYKDRPVSAAEGFFIRSADAGQWEAVKPYDWPGEPVGE